MKKLLRQVKIQGNWLTVEVLHVYGGFKKAWYALLNNAGFGWVDIKNGLRVVDPNEDSIIYGWKAVNFYRL